jgi:hypothetical protein
MDPDRRLTERREHVISVALWGVYGPLMIVVAVQLVPAAKTTYIGFELRIISLHRNGRNE